MRVLKAYRFRLDATPRVAREVGRVAGCCRFVWNRALALQEERHVRQEKRLGYGELCRVLTTWRHAQETAFLAAAPTHPLQQALKDLGRAYHNFFEGRAAPPRFKKKGRSDEGFRYPDPKQFEVDDRNGRVKLPKLGWVRYRRSRAVLGAPKQITVSREGAHWFVSIQTEHEVPEPVHPSTSTVGLDVGVAKFAALSTGETYTPVSAFRKYQKKLARAQRALARRRSSGRTGTKRRPGWRSWARRSRASAATSSTGRARASATTTR